MLIGAILFIASSCIVQKQVGSGTYNLMLKTLLSHSVNEVSVKEADSMSNVVFIDSREKEEYEVSHIKNAVWVGYDDFDIKRMSAISKEKKIVVYCAVGARSEKIAEELLKNGYSDVSNLYGGIFEWVNKGKPVYNNSGKTTKVHAYSKAWGIWLKKGGKVYGENPDD
jgi:rhodanese-related sulfurtransferase